MITRPVGSDVPSEFLERLQRWLSDSEPAPDEATAVRRRPWAHLEYQANAPANVRQTELQRLQNAGRAEDRVRSDYRGRYAIELLQNAHDACADANMVGEAWLYLTPSALLVANQGVPFTAERIDSLLQLGDSSKSADRVQHHTIGYKGIGFSAVLEITDRPQVISESAAFCFDRAAARARVEQVLGEAPDAIPMRYFPFPLERSDLGADADLVDELLARGAVTVIRLPLTDRRTLREVSEELTTGVRPETLLFMRHLQRVTVATPDGSSTWSSRKGHRVGPGQLQHLREDGGRTRSWLLAQTSVALPEAEVEALDDPLWATVRTANVAVAVPWRNGKPDPDRDTQPLHVYFPTDDRLGRALLVHGDFYVQSHRRRIDTVGPGADVSLRIADAAAELTAQLAVSLAPHGNALLRTLAPRSEPDGFGGRLAELIDARLRECPMLYAASEEKPTVPANVRRIAAPLDRRQLTALVELLADSGDVLRPGDDVGCGEWLETLGVRPLPATELASRLTPGTSVGYDAALAVVSRWFRALSGYEAGLVGPALKQRPLLLDTDGNWCASSALVRMDPRTPRLPSVLRRPAYEPPHSRAACEFVDTVLQVEVLTPERALRSVLDHVAKGIIGDAAQEVLRFLQALWASTPSVLQEAGPARLGRVPVPARVLGQTTRGWVPASTAYFDRRWTGNDVLERLYGRFRQTEFLAIDAPTDGARRAEKRFWSALGVADAPRALPIGSVGTARLSGWLEIDEVRAARRCRDGHPGSRSHYRGTCLDRLDEILENGDERSLRALASHLRPLKKPLGEPVFVSCTHGAHARAVGKPVIGFQEWLLTTHAWLPTDGGPGGARLRRPREAWLDVPKGPARSVLASPHPPLTDPAALGIRSIHRPGFDRLEAAMREVEVAYPDLDAAPRVVQEGVDWLLRKLDASARTGADDDGPDRAPNLPAMRNMVRIWAPSPVIADIPGSGQVPDVAWLSDAPWGGLQRRYRLERASVVVTTVVSGTPAPRANKGLLNHQDRIRLLALLLDRGGEADAMANRLGHLTERRMLSLHVDYAIYDRHWSAEPAFHLRQQRDSRGRVRAAELSSLVNLSNADLVQLGHALAQHLGVPAHGDLVGSFLIVREGLLEANRILPAQLVEAEDALRRFRVDDEDLPAEEAPAEGDDTPDAPEQPDGAQSAQGREAGSAMGLAGPPGPWPRATSRAGYHASGSEAPGAAAATAQPPAPTGTVVFGQGERRVASPPASRPAPPGGARPVTGDRPGAGTTGELPADQAPDLRATEKAAEDVAVRFLERRFAASVERVGELNLGWDLTATLPNGNRLLVEVKGFSTTSTAFVLTPGELRKALEQLDEYRLCVVTGVGGATGELAWFEDVEDVFAESHREPYQWLVRHWASSEHDRFPWAKE